MKQDDEDKNLVCFNCGKNKSNIYISVCVWVDTFACDIFAGDNYRHFSQTYPATATKPDQTVIVKVMETENFMFVSSNSYFTLISGKTKRNNKQHFYFYNCRC